MFLIHSYYLLCTITKPIKNYFSFLFLSKTLFANAQTNCDYANSYLVSAYYHIKISYNSYNINDLKYYVNRSIEAFKLSKKLLLIVIVKNFRVY